MKYKAEIVVNRKVVGEFYDDKATHPRQVVRKIIHKNKKVKYFILYIMNENGEAWRYSVMKQNDGKMLVRKMERSVIIADRNTIDLVFTGNLSISEVYY